MLKRAFDVFVSLVALFLLLPIFLFIAIAIKLDSPGSIFFRQERVGQYGALFLIHKFRTMYVRNAQQDLQITLQLDSRITRVGRFLRKTKMDELPQLIDVLSGRMSLVGPRPEVPRYVEYYPPEERDIIQLHLPGITDLASIKFRNESDLLNNSENPEATYINQILPIKIKYYVDYAKNRSFYLDIKIIALTMISIIFR